MLSKTLQRLSTSGRTRACSKCKQRTLVSELPDATQACLHNGAECASCLTARIRSHVSRKAAPTLRCPAASCGARLTGEDVLRVTNDFHLSTQYDNHRLSFYLCAACGKDLPIASFKLRSKRCSHPPTSCDICVVRHIFAESTSPFVKAVCPTPDCGQLICRDDVVRACTTTTYSSVAKALKPLVGPRTCDICFHDFEQFSFRRMTSECRHAPTVCIFCVTRHLRVEVNSAQRGSIECLSPDCNACLSVGDVARLTDGRLAMRFQKLRLRNGGKGCFRWCTRPGCTAGQIVVSDSVIMICRKCGAKSCVRHRVPWHVGLDCEAYERVARKEVDGVVLALGEGRIKRCPGCGHAVEKRSGCDHITCDAKNGGCGMEFCWLCFTDYNGARGIRAIGNSAHTPTCRHYVA